jgi:hypothetical protein
MNKLLYTLILSLSITACGGGGGNDDPWYGRWMAYPETVFGKDNFVVKEFWESFPTEGDCYASPNAVVPEQYIKIIYYKCTQEKPNGIPSVN